MVNFENHNIKEEKETSGLKKLQESIDTVLKSIDLVLTTLDDLKSRINRIEVLISPEFVSPKPDYFEETLDAVMELLVEKKGIPVSRTELAEFMNLSESTIYQRCEKLVEKGKLQKFYGRDLRLEPAKSVFYSIPRTLYDVKVLENLEEESAKKIARGLLESTRINEKILLSAGTLSKTEKKEGIDYLLNRGLIARKTESDGTTFYVIQE